MLRLKLLQELVKQHENYNSPHQDPPSRWPPPAERLFQSSECQRLLGILRVRTPFSLYSYSTLMETRARSPTKGLPASFFLNQQTCAVAFARVCLRLPWRPEALWHCPRERPISQVCSGRLQELLLPGPFFSPLPLENPAIALLINLRMTSTLLSRHVLPSMKLQKVRRIQVFPGRS